MKPWHGIPYSELGEYTAKILFQRNNPYIRLSFPHKKRAEKIALCLHSKQLSQATALVRSCRDPLEAAHIFSVMMTRRCTPVWLAFAKNPLLVGEIGSQELNYFLTRVDSELQDPFSPGEIVQLEEIGIIIASDEILCRRVGARNLLPFTEYNTRLRDFIIRNGEFLTRLDYTALSWLCRTSTQTESVVKGIVEVLKNDETRRIRLWAATALEAIVKKGIIGEHIVKRHTNDLLTALAPVLSPGDELEPNKPKRFPYPNLQAALTGKSLSRAMAALAIDRTRANSMPTPALRSEKAENTDSDRENSLPRERSLSLPTTRSYASLPVLTDFEKEKQELGQESVFATQVFTPLRTSESSNQNISDRTQEEGSKAVYVVDPDAPENKRNKNIFSRICSHCP